MAKPAHSLKIRNVSKMFGGVRALDSVAFDVIKGEVHCLAGENGCGKSTLIKIVTGVYAPDPGGEIEIFGEAQKKPITPSHARAMGIAVIWQDLALFPHMTVAENIAFDGIVGRIPGFLRHSSIRKQAAKVLERLGTELDLDVRLNSLPIAQRQIVAIARALMGETRLIFMDEPTSSLTQSETRRLLEIVRNLSKQEVAVVFVSHRLAEVLEVSSRVTVLRDGKLVGVYPTAGITQARLGELMTGKLFEHTSSARDRKSASAVLEVSDLSRRGEFQDVSFSIREGEVVGLTGLIGAGRTELAHALIGMTRPDSGSVQLNGQPIEPKSIRDAITAGFAYVSEDRLSLGLIQQQSISDNTAIAVLNRLVGKFGLISRHRKNGLVGDWINKLAIKIGHPEHPVSTLSGGNQQRVVLAKWLATNPKVLILDSPTVGVDVGARAGIFKIIRDLADRGMAILLISDEVAEVLLNSDRVLHMAEGLIRSEYDSDELDIETLESLIYA